MGVQRLACEPPPLTPSPKKTVSSLAIARNLNFTLKHTLIHFNPVINYELR